MQNNEGQASPSTLPIIMVNNTNAIQPRKDQQLRYMTISKGFNGRTAAPIVRTMSGSNNITMMMPSSMGIHHGPTTKIYRVPQQSSSSSSGSNSSIITTTTRAATNSPTASDGLPVGSLSSHPPPASPHSPVQIEIAPITRPSPLSSPDSGMEPSKKRIRNNKEYDNYSPSTFKPGPKPSVDDHLLDERALDRRNRRRASNRQAARKQRDKRLRKMQDYENALETVTTQRDDAVRKVAELSALIQRIVQTYPDVGALIDDEPLTNNLDSNEPLVAIELKKGRALRDEFYVAKTELLDDDGHNNGTIVIEQKEDEDEDDDSTSVTDVIKLEADFD